MKKLLIVFVIAASFSLTACSSTISLSADNYADYITYEVSFSDPVYEPTGETYANKPMYSLCCYCTIKIKPAVSFNIKTPIKINCLIESKGGWTIRSGNYLLKSPFFSVVLDKDGQSSFCFAMYNESSKELFFPDINSLQINISSASGEIVTK